MHRWIFWILLLLLPTQLGKHFWPDSAFIFGIRVDYLSPTVYLTDMVVVLLLIVWLLEKWTGRWLDKWISRFKQSKFYSPIYLPVYLSIYLLIHSLFIAQNQGAAFYKLVKIVEFLLLGFYAYRNSRFILASRLWSSTLSLVVLYTSFLGILQSFTQASVGGIFWWLGERAVSLASPGIALATFGGQEFLRPYSTFSHPNSFAGFLLVVLILLFPARNILERLAFVFGTVVIFLSFSQNVWLAGAFVIFLFLLKNAKRFFKPLFVFFLILGVFSSFPAPWSILPIAKNTEIVLRQELLFAGEKMFLDSPIFGVGLNNFINLLPFYGATPVVSWWLQPVHNVFVLWTVETGLVGLLFLFYYAYFLWWIFKRPAAGNLHLALLAIFLTGLFDHHWLTLQQNQLLLAIVLGVLARYTVSKRSLTAYKRSLSLRDKQSLTLRDNKNA